LVAMTAAQATGVTPGADTAVTAVIGAVWCAPPPNGVRPRSDWEPAQSRSQRRLGAPLTLDGVRVDHDE